MSFNTGFDYDGGEFSDGDDSYDSNLEDNVHEEDDDNFQQSGEKILESMKDSKEKINHIFYI